MITNSGLKQQIVTKDFDGLTTVKNEWIEKFDKLGAEYFVVSDYSDEFKIIYNEQDYYVFTSRKRLI